MGFQKFGTGEVLGHEQDNAQDIQATASGDQPWTPEDDVELERESTKEG